MNKLKKIEYLLTQILKSNDEDVKTLASICLDLIECEKEFNEDITTLESDNYNIKILNELKNQILKKPEFRFHQLLWSVGIFEKSNGEIIDKFFETSETTWSKLQK